MSAEDIPKGAQWTARLTSELKLAAFALICVTQENQHKPWLNFEAGALSNALTDARVCPLLLDISTTDVDGPLTVYQMAEINEEDVLRVLRSINEHLEQPLAAEKLNVAFKRWWPDFSDSVASIAALLPARAEPHRTTDDLVREVLDVVRTQARTLGRIASVMPPEDGASFHPQPVGGYKSGDFVVHEMWGEGVVLNVARTGMFTHLTVMFRKRIGQKMLIAEHAPLTRVDRPSTLITRPEHDELKPSFASETDDDGHIDDYDDDRMRGERDDDRDDE